MVYAQDSIQTNSNAIEQIKHNLIKIYLCDETILECVDIEKQWRAGPSNEFPFYQVTIEGFNCWDGTVSFGFNMFDVPIIQGVPDSVQAIGFTQLRAIEKIVYPNGKVLTSNEINSINRKWKFGITLAILGVLTTLVLIS